MNRRPVYVDPFLGAGAVWLALLDADLVPLVSWMGGKRRLARPLLSLLGLRPGRVLLGQRVGEDMPALLGDASWWGWVWATVLDAETGPRVSATLRGWRGEDPRALWFRLRDLGPVDGRAEAAAQMLWLQARAASGVPVWWESDPVSMDGHGRGPYRAWQMTGQTRTARLLQEASTQIDDAGQRQARDPRLLAGSEGSEGSEGSRTANAKGFHRLAASDGRGDPREAGARTTRQERLVATTRGGQEPGAPFEAGHKGTDTRGGGGIVDPGTIADRADRIRARLVKASGGEAGISGNDGFRRKHGWRLFEPGDVADRADAIRARALGDALIVHAGALALTEEWAPRLGADGRVYLDPPYQGATGYPVGCPRSEVLLIAETWARHGARVVLSEAVGLAGELGPGWSEACLRVGEKPEWVTTYRCEAATVATGAA